MTENTEETLWYIARDGQQHGPISETEMRLFVDNGHLKPTDLLWRPGFADWRAASEVFPLPAPVSPVAPTPTAPVAAAKPDTDKPASPGSSTRDPARTDSSVPSSAGPGAAADKPAQPAARAPAAEAKRGHPGQGVGSERPVAGAGPQQASASMRSAQGEPARPQGAPAYGPGGEPRPSRQSPYRPSGTGMGSMNPMGATATTKAPSYEPAMATGPSDKVGTGGPAPARRGRAVKFALAGLLVALIGGSFYYLVTQKDEMMAMMGGGEASDKVPVVKATPVPAKPPEQTAALQTPQIEERRAPPAGPDANNQAEPPAAPQAPAPEAAQPSGAADGQQAATESTITPTATPPGDDASGFDAYYQQSKLWQYMKRAYPDWYDQRMREVAPLGTGGQPPLDATKSLVQGLVALRRQHANDALLANTDRLKAIATAFLDNLQALSENGADACYSFISQGETSTKSLDLFHRPQSAPALEQQALTIFEAIAAGKAAPAKHERPKKGDYDVLAAELGKLGWSQADLQLFADPKALSSAPPARVCQMVRDWFKAHIAISDASVQERLLFETLRPVVSG